MSAATSSSGSAKVLCNRRWRAQLTMMAVVAAPLVKASNAPSAASTRAMLPSTRLSASIDRKPVMCEVYSCTTRNPPALTAPALKASSWPSTRLLVTVRW